MAGEAIRLIQFKRKICTEMRIKAVIFEIGRPVSKKNPLFTSRAANQC